MEQSTNLGLNLITDSAADKAMLFSEWREKVSGAGENSNMQKIDEAFGDLQSVMRNEKTLTGNMFVIDDGDGTESELTVDVTDMKKIGLIPGGSSILEVQSVIVCNRNIHKGQSTAEFSTDNLTWKLNIQFDGILPPGDYILSYHYKGLLPKHRRILSYTRYEDNQWKMINGSYVPLDNEVTDVDELIEDTITLEYPYSVFTYNFLTSGLTDITGTQYVSDIMLRPAGVTENIYTPHKGTVYSVPNNDTENTVSNIIKVGQNIVYCGSGLGHLTYMSEKYATKAEANHIRAVIDEAIATTQDDYSALSAHFPATGKFVVGTNTSATEENAVAEGEDTIASGLSSHAEGYASEASGDYSHSEGGSIASGGCSHAEGSASEASGENAHAEGYETTASGDNSHSEGWGATASGMNAHAEGVDTVASGNQSHSEGEGTIANHAAQSVSGTYNVADTSQAAATAKGTYAEIVGNGTADNARSNARTLDWSGNEELAGDLTIKKGGAGEKKVSVIASDVADLKAHFPSTNFKVGTNTVSNGGNSVAEGTDSTASNQNAHAEGNGSVASGKNAHAEGGWNVGMIPGESRRYSTASGTSSHAEGSGCHADGTGTHAEGVATTATGEGAHSEGRVTDAHGTGSHAEGYNTIAQYNYQHVSGQFNAVETGAEIVGNGTGSDNRKNIRVLDWNGNEKLAGSLTLGLGTADEVTITAAQLRQLLAMLS